MTAGRHDRQAWQASLGLLTEVCRLAHLPGFETGLSATCEAEGIVQAVADHDTPRLFAWLLQALQYQGVSDQAASAYAAARVPVGYADVALALAGEGELCPRLAGFAAFVDCRYRKSAGTCANPPLLASCPLPRHDLRNGRLNQAAYSLFLFIRDVCGGDLVGWLDTSLVAADCGEHPERLARLRAAVLEPFRAIVGIGDKVARMLLADLLIGTDPGRQRWVDCGRSLVVVDTLVHAWLHRTGILARSGRPHRYGAVCYQPGGCAELLEHLARDLDVRGFDSSLPAYHPRFVQHAVWRYCAGAELDICNGNRIDDRDRCANTACTLHRQCGRVALRPVTSSSSEAADGQGA